MACEYCHRDGYHSVRCPLYKSPKSSKICSICGDGILDGEEYIENVYGEYRHYDCFQGIRELLDWLGCSIKIMDSNYD